MVFEHIEKLKREYTDKYVVVDESLPELRRFRGQTGTVRTVNMSGKALVEFDAYDNIGWYDIDVDYLKVIEKPLPKPEAPAKKAAPAKKESPAKKAPSELEKARASKDKPAATPAASAKAPAKTSDTSKMSVEEMLAAARAGDSGGSSAAAKPAAKATESKAAGDPKSMSVEEMLAAARAGDGGGGSAAPAAEPEAAPEPEPEPAAAAPEPEPEPEAPSEPQGDLPTDVDGMVEYCRRVDGS